MLLVLFARSSRIAQLGFLFGLINVWAAPGIADSSTETTEPSYDEIVGSFDVQFIVDSTAPTTKGSGHILGMPFNVEIGETGPEGLFDITVTPVTLGGHSSWYVAVFVNGIECIPLRPFVPEVLDFTEFDDRTVYVGSCRSASAGS